MNLRGSKGKGTLEKLESLEQNYDITSLLTAVFKYIHIHLGQLLVQYVKSKKSISD